MLRLLAAAALVAGTAHHAGRSEDAFEPGESRWPVKVSVPAGADVDHPVEVPLAALLALAPPPGVTHRDAGPQGRLDAARIDTPLVVGTSATLHEGDIVATEGFVTVVAGETDGDFHVQLAERPWDESAFEQAPCLIVEVPADERKFGASDDLRRRFASAREFLQSTLLGGEYPGGRGVAIKRATRVRVTGQLFADVWHLKKDGGLELRGKRGQTSPTIWELHPVIAIVAAPPPP